MNRQFIYNLFVEACLSEESKRRRAFAVNYQFNRKAWQLPCKHGLVRIMYQGDTHIITFWPTITYEKLSGEYGKQYDFYLTENEYQELEKLYFADIKPNKKYWKEHGYEFNHEPKPSRMKTLKLWLIPVGIGIGTLAGYLATKKIHESSVYIFIAAVVLWLMHEIYKSASGYYFNMRYLALNYHARDMISLITGPWQKCDCCKRKVSTTISIEHDSKDGGKDKSVCLNCYVGIMGIWKRTEKPKTSSPVNK